MMRNSVRAKVRAKAMQSYADGTAKRRSVRKWKATEPRAFGKAGHKLAKKIDPIYA